MTEPDHPWVIHEEKAHTALEEARLLLDAGFHDGASIRAAGSCIQMAKATAVKLQQKDDPAEWLPALTRMMKDGRMPSGLHRPLMQIMKAHQEDVATSRVVDAKHAREMIELTETFHRVLISAAAVTLSLQSPKVKRAMAAKGVKLSHATYG